MEIKIDNSMMTYDDICTESLISSFNIFLYLTLIDKYLDTINIFSSNYVVALTTVGIG